MNDGDVVEEKTKLRVKLGAAEIDYEGSTQFLKNEIMPTVDKIFKIVEEKPELRGLNPLQRISHRSAPLLDGVEIAPIEVMTEAKSESVGNSRFSSSLASALRACNAEKKQVMRFLVTAAWLHARGSASLSSGAVARALQDNQQSRLGNPADCLNKNVAKGYCEKTKDGFFVTPEGWEVLGGSL